MRRLAARHTVHLGCLLDEPADAAHADSARQWAASVLAPPRAAFESAWRGATGAVVGRPLSVGWFGSGRLAGDVRNLLERESIDVAVSYCSSMAGYLRNFHGPRVLDFVDVDSLKWRQYARRSGFPKSAVYSLEGKLLESWERRLAVEFDRSVIISERERESLAAFADVTRVDVVSNGVDVDYWAAGPPRAPRRELVFVGALDYFANEDGIVDFVQRVFPTVRRRVPDVVLRVVGRQPGPAVLALGNVPGVEVVGEVDDVRPELARAGVAVAPLRIAQGLQNKVLEAMAADVPVVSSASAVRGIDAEAGREFRLAEAPEEWADAIAELLDATDVAGEQATRAAAMVRERYSWDRKASEYEAVFEAACDSWRASRNGASR